MHIHFSHANGFPAPVYKKLLNSLKKKGFQLSWLEKHGHNPEYPVTNNWPFLVDELINEIIKTNHQPVIAVGHSLGGVLSSFASCQMPELFQAVIMLDPPLFTPLEGFCLHWMKRFGFIDNIAPVNSALNRRSVWDSREQALNAYSKKKLFCKFDPECLIDYVENGMIHKEDRLELSFNSTIEADIFRNIPSFWGRIKSSTVPTSIIYADKSEIMRPFRIFTLRKILKINSIKVPGTHMFPLEIPEMTSQVIVEQLKTMKIINEEN